MQQEAINLGSSLGSGPGSGPGPGMGQKKKTRIRNRPRNKCNRTEETVLIPTNVEPPQEQSKNEENNDAIKIIQKLLRKKLLAKSNNATTSTLLQGDVAKLGPLPVKTQKDSKENEMNELLKSLGSKLQRAGAVGESPTATLFSNLGKLFNKAPPSDVESSDDEAEYIEYIYKPRQYFLASLCNLCKTDLCGQQIVPCSRCGLNYYCSGLHMQNDQGHRQLCYALRQTVESNGHDMFYKCGDFTTEQFRSYRIVCIRQVEKAMNRSLSATEQEVLLFPLICSNAKCREHRFKRLSLCTNCGEVAYCKDKPNHLNASHSQWCPSYRLFKAFVIFQSKFGRLEPSLPNRILKDIPMACCNTRQMMQKLNFNIQDVCEYAALTQVATGPLTAWYALKLCQRLRDVKELTIHLIGAEIEFEVDILQKWELFMLHIMPTVKVLNVVFIGPELNPNNISFDQLKKFKCCRYCRKGQRSVNYYFENKLYHHYCSESHFINPSLVCFFNSGLYRSTGYAMEDTWPDTIQSTLNLKCPIVVTSYTKYEAPLDMSQFINQSNRHLNIVLPPTANPFTSEKPERNFISDQEEPFMFKNCYCFVVE